MTEAPGITSRIHRNLLEQRKKEIERELAKQDPLREELREIDALLRGFSPEEPRRIPGDL